MSSPTSVPLHVEYVAPGTEDVGEALAFTVEVLGEPVHAALIAGTTLATLGVVLAYLRVRPAARDLAVLRATLLDYRDLLPWLLRISFGMALVGAGFAGYYVSPAVEIEARLLQVTLGFLILFGLGTRVAAVLVVVAFLAVLPAHPVILFQGEFVGGLLAIVLCGSGRPSADHVLQRVAGAPGTVYGELDPVHRFAEWFQARVDPYRRYLPSLVRVTLGGQFVFLGVFDKLAQPGKAVATVEQYDLTRVIPVDPGMWVVGAGLAEIAVGIALIVGAFTRAVAGLAFVLFTLTLFALPDDPVLAHLSLFGLASVLIVTGGGPLSLDERLWGGSGDS